VDAGLAVLIMRPMRPRPEEGNVGSPFAARKIRPTSSGQIASDERRETTSSSRESKSQDKIL